MAIMTHLRERQLVQYFVSSLDSIKSAVVDPFYIEIEVFEVF